MKGQLKKRFNYKKIIQDLDIIAELEKRGINGRVIGANLQINCPIHGERNPSMGIGVFGQKKGICNCLSCGWSGSFFSFLSFLDDVSIDHLIKKFSKNDISIEELSEMKKYLFNELKTKENKVDKIKYYNKKFLDKFPKPYGEYLRYLIKQRKLTKEIIEKFDIRCCNGKGQGYAGAWKNRIVIPIIDTNGKLAGCTARYIYDCENSFKVRKIKDSDISKVLFGLRNIKKGSPVIGLEGEIDVIYLQQFNIPAVKVGKFLSKSMINKLMMFTDTFIYGPDGDVPYVNSNPKKHKDSIKYQKDIISKYMNVEIIQLPDGKDPNDLTEKEVKKYYGKYINKKYFK